MSVQYAKPDELAELIRTAMARGLKVHPPDITVLVELPMTEKEFLRLMELLKERL